MDWALIESWKERDVPLHVALRGIERAFDSFEAKKRKRSVKTLLYCQEEVESQYAEWLESRVGSHDNSESAPISIDSSPFPPDVVISYLSRLLDELSESQRDLSYPRNGDLTEAFARAINLLEEIRQDYESASRPDARKLEESLTGLERMLDDAIRKALSESDIEKACAEVDSQLKPYKRHMDKSAFEQTRDNLLRKRLREGFGIPRLSLFFLQA
jgi:hypothetical protein